jgi:hypothetical protein
MERGAHHNGNPRAAGSVLKVSAAPSKSRIVAILQGRRPNAMHTTSVAPVIARRSV